MFKSALRAAHGTRARALGRDASRNCSTRPRHARCAVCTPQRRGERPLAVLCWACCLQGSLLSAGSTRARPSACGCARGYTLPLGARRERRTRQTARPERATRSQAVDASQAGQQDRAAAPHSPAALTRRSYGHTGGPALPLSRSRLSQIASAWCAVAGGSSEVQG